MCLFLYLDHIIRYSNANSTSVLRGLYITTEQFRGILRESCRCFQICTRQLMIFLSKGGHVRRQIVSKNHFFPTMNNIFFSQADSFIKKIAGHLLIKKWEVLYKRKNRKENLLKFNRNKEMAIDSLIEIVCKSSLLSN